MTLANLRGITCFITTVQIFPDSVQAGMKEHFKQSFLAKTRVIISWDCLFVDEVRLIEGTFKSFAFSKIIG